MTTIEAHHSWQDDSERIRSSTLLRALHGMQAAVLVHDSEGRLDAALNLPPSLDTAADGAEALLQRLEPDVGGGLYARERDAVVESGTPRTVQMRFTQNGKDRWFEVHIEPDVDFEGRTGTVTTFVDVTAHRRREQTLRALLRELSHRSKNLLAIIQSVATQTGRYSGTIEGFLTRFRGRIQSLAASQDLITSSNWDGARLYDLATDQIGRYCDHPSLSLSFDGENPRLNPNAALHIGLALHELAVNSVSYGALSGQDGRVSLSCRLRPDGWIELTWDEDTPPQSGSNGDRRFGSIALERVVPVAVSGEAHLDMDDGHLRYKLDVPPQSVAEM